MDTNTIQFQIDSLKFQVKAFENLSSKLDSLSNLKRIDKIQLKLDESADIISSVNEFYDSAWTKLIVVITLLGVILPIIIQYFQRKNNKEMFKQSMNEFRSEIESKITILNGENERKFNEITEKYQQEIIKIQSLHEKQVMETDGSIFYLQGRVRYSEKNYKNALIDFLNAANNYNNTSNYERAKVMLEFIHGSILGIERKKDFDLVLKEKEKDWSLIISKFCTEENRITYKDYIDKINLAVLDLK